MWFWFLCVASAAVYSVDGAGAGAARLVCYVEGARASDFTECTHLVYAGDARGEKLNALLKDYRKDNPRLKILLRVSEADEKLEDLLKSKHVQGLEVHDAHRTFNKSKALETVEAARAAISSSGGGPLFLSLPAHPELLAKYYDLRALMKSVDLMMVQTHALGLVKKMTYHPSRLSGLWDMMNTDSVVDLVIGLGVPASKIVISLPATARKFTLLNETLSTPGSPTEDDDPKEIDQAELCRQLRKGRWTLERDQDLSAPYAFKDKTWISFEDASSVDVKGKYARVRGLAGLALFKADRDTETPCGPTLRAALTKVLNQQSRAPRAAVLRSLENEILSAPGQFRALDALQVSPYRITQVVDSDGVIHSIREDTRTEFSCTRQGYFVHPRSCARFYRCVKFDQLSPEFTVFEFDCPAGLAFDSRYEVCVWPGSLPHSQACPGSSEIAPVPRSRFQCPDHEGYYADPENCRWFFACLDHGKAPLEAYEFRCPFGLGFDAARLKCDWPWLVPGCGNIARYEAEAFGFSGAALSGATGFQGKTADSVNIAAHQSLVSGASFDNLVGIQNGFLTKDDILDTNYIASQEISSQGFAGPGTYQIDDGEPSGLSYNIVPADNKGLGQAANYNNDNKYTSGSLILDEYRLPSNKGSYSGIYNAAQKLNAGVYKSSSRFDSGKYRGNDAYPGASPSYNSGKYNGGYYRKDKSGAYVHNPAGDRAKPYIHIDVPPVPYEHIDFKYKQTNDTGGEYTGTNANGGGYTGSYETSSNNQDGSYSSSGGYLYPKPAIEFNEGPAVSQNFYSSEGKLDSYQSGSIGASGGTTTTYHGSYSIGGDGKYISDNEEYNGATHTLTAGAVNVELVGKTSLVDVDFANQANYGGLSNNYEVIHQGYTAEPAVSVSHVGTNSQNFDGYSFATTPTSSGVPTTATPLPVTYKTTYVPEVPKTSIKQVFGYTQPAVTLVRPTVVPINQAPQVKVTDYNQGLNYQYESKDYTSTYNADSTRQTNSDGYVYTKPADNENIVTYSTAIPSATVISYKPQGFGHSQQTIHKVESVGFDYSTPKPTYTTGPSVSTYAQPTAQSFNQQTVHSVDSTSYNPSIDIIEQNGANINYEVPQTIIKYTTPQPAVSTYQQQAFTQQTLHTVDTSKVNIYSQDQYEQGYEYKQPNIEFKETPKTVIQYSTPAPTLQGYSSQTIQRFGNKQYVPVSTTVRPTVSTAVTINENPLLKYTIKATPTTYISSTYIPQSYSQQTGVGSTGYQYNSGNNYEESSYYTRSSQPVVQSTLSTSQPQSYSQQTLHKVAASKVNANEGSSFSGYDYTQPALSISYENAKVISSTPTPVVTSTYKPTSYRQQTIHKLERQRIPSTTPLSIVDFSYEQSAVTVDKNPFLQYTQKVTPITYAEPTGTVSFVSQPTQYETSAQLTYTNKEGYSYSQPEIQSNVEALNTAKYSDASAVSHQTFHLSHGTGNTHYESGKDVVFVSSTPANLVYEDHYAEYEAPKKIKTYKAPEYIPPKQEYEQTVTVSTPSTPTTYQQSSVVHTQDQFDYKPVDYSQQSISDTSQIVESVHFSSFPDTKTTQYQAGYQSPEIQVGYKAEEYLPPIVSIKTPVVTTTYRPRTYSTTTYLPPTRPKTKFTAPEYLPPLENTTPETKTLEYLPPHKGSSAKTVSFESFGFNKEDETVRSDAKLSTYQDYSVPNVTPIAVSSTVAPVLRKQNVVVEASKSNLLGFGTVGPDAGLVSTSFTTAVPIISDSYYLSPKRVTSTYAPEIIEVTSATRRTRPKYVRPAVKSTTQSYVESTTAYHAPEYLPPVEQVLQENVESIESSYKSTAKPKIRYNPYQEQKIENSPIYVSTVSTPIRKQNIVVETAKSQLLGFGTVGTDAGLVSSSSNGVSDSVVISNEGSSYSTVPVEQELIEVTQEVRRKTKPKVAVVTKINDFNPLLVRKLGAVCSCQSPILILRGKRPINQEQDIDYSTRYENTGSEDFNDNAWAQKSARISTRPVATATPIVTSTFNPIIVPDDSFYQDYQDSSNDNIAIAPVQKEYTERFVSSTPIISTTERVVRIKPRVKEVTAAPTYKTIILNEESASGNAQESDSTVSETDSQSFDRYGPGGWRNRDETLQGSIDCKRAGLFRHPKQCNKFYACRWDCTKQRFTLHVFNCPVQLSFDPNLGACNWPSQGPACQGDTLLTNAL
ncbi:uncharacterized protein LOC123657183 [Melitaea cinxia]|uniref:uncharacterized protein LOC123657183 n=1 Tax=Melitaea cinxia TaxID=113334 RepID=UPI001E272641|nr:uncharacterized protein LOC123657183 [Melitaea cinxia]